MICEHCHCVFCWDDADEYSLIGEHKLYCSKECRRNAKNKRGQRPSKSSKWRNYCSRRACEERQKLVYDSKEEAWYAISQFRRIPPLSPYLCPCGSWHLTSQNPEGARTAT